MVRWDPLCRSFVLYQRGRNTQLISAWLAQLPWSPLQSLAAQLRQEYAPAGPRCTSSTSLTSIIGVGHLCLNQMLEQTTRSLAQYIKWLPGGVWCPVTRPSSNSTRPRAQSFCTSRMGTKCGRQVAPCFALGRPKCTDADVVDRRPIRCEIMTPLPKTNGMFLAHFWLYLPTVNRSET